MKHKKLKKLLAILQSADLKPSPNGNYYVKMSPTASAEIKKKYEVMRMIAADNDPDYLAYRRINKLGEFEGGGL